MPSPQDLIARLDLLLRDQGRAAAEPALRSVRGTLNPNDAVVVLDAMVTRAPDWVTALHELGQAMLALREYRAAFNIGARIEQLDASDPRGLRLQALAMDSHGAAPAQVLPLWRKLGALSADASDQFMLATTTSRLGFYGEMHAALDATLAAAPDFLLARWAKFLTPIDKFFASRAVIDAFIAQWDAGCADFERRDLDTAALRPQLEHLLLAQCNFHLAYTGIDVTSRQRQLGALLRRMARAALPQFDTLIRTAPVAGRRLRIGFATPTLRHHTVMKLFGGLMTRLPRERFSVHAYALETGSDAVTESLRATLDGVRTDIAPLATMASRIRDDALDALIYLDVGMHPRSVAMSALRLAPFQAMLWGHPVTSGVDTIDAFLSSALMEPSDGAQHYTERLDALPGLGCWYDPGALCRQPPANLPPRERLSLVCAQNGLKLLPEQDAVFARILAALPEADLTLLTGLQTGVETNLLARMRPVFESFGVDFERRVRVLGLIDESRFLDTLWQADLVLDTLAWSGGVTAFETFWGDVPVLTLPGPFMRGRHTAAMLTRMDLPELIADDAEDFIVRATRLAQDGSARERLRGLIRDRKLRLYRDDDVVAALADLLTRKIDRRASSD